jgi:hypothetical protein
MTTMKRHGSDERYGGFHRPKRSMFKSGDGADGAVELVI